MEGDINDTERETPYKRAGKEGSTKTEAREMTDIEFVESEFITRDGVRVRQDTGEPAPEELSEDDQAFRAWKKKQAKIKRYKLKRGD